MLKLRSAGENEPGLEGAWAAVVDPGSKTNPIITVINSVSLNSSKG